jgi:hypothetical protein
MEATAINQVKFFKGFHAFSRFEGDSADMCAGKFPLIRPYG